MKTRAPMLLFFIVILGGLFLLSAQTFAQSSGGLVPDCPLNDPNCVSKYDPDNYGTCEVVLLVNNIIRFSIGLVALLATITLVVSGYRLVVSQGNASALQNAKDNLNNILIGLVIVLGAFLIVNTVLSVLVGSNSSIMNWNNIKCSYANQAGDPTSTSEIKIGHFENGLYVQSGWTVIGGNSGRYSYGVGGGGGSCSVVSDSSNACHPSKLGCFGDAQAASKVCNLESSGGHVGAVSATDMCQGGFSFSGGLFQVNVLANYDKIPGCSAGFFVKNGSSAQGTCLRRITNSNGTEYCALRDCRITNVPMYEKCMAQIMNVSTNLQIACNLYRADGWNPWITSATACGVVH